MLNKIQTIIIFTGDETWIYSYEPEIELQFTVWLIPNEPNPTEVFRSRSTSKKMIACFIVLTRHIAAIPLEDRKTTNVSDIQKFVCQK